MLDSNFLTGVVDWFDWRYQNGYIVQEDGTRFFFTLKGGRLPELIVKGKQKLARLNKPEMYPKKSLNGKEILFVISPGPKGPLTGISLSNIFFKILTSVRTSTIHNIFDGTSND